MCLPRFLSQKDVGQGNGPSKLLCNLHCSSVLSARLWFDDHFESGAAAWHDSMKHDCFVCA